ncbi:TPA: hypothetical protein ACGPMP_003344 [Enterobacter roggenkampii]|nr:hypothetical protein [Enterobacter asburiae]
MLDKISLMLRLLSPDYDSTDEYQEQYKELTGLTGELITMGYLDLWGAKYFHIEQKYGNKPLWLKKGKRPDFVAFTTDPDETILIDAKFHAPKEGKFRIEIKDLLEYEELVSNLSSNGRKVGFLFIMPIGGCSINNFYCYTLDDFTSGTTSDDGKFKLVDVTEPLNAYDLQGSE